MNREFFQLVERIRNELHELEVVLQRVNEGWQRAKQSSDDFLCGQRCSELTWLLLMLFSQVQSELLSFAEFLEQQT